MDANRRTISLGFTDEPASEGCHICYIYKDEAERHQVMAKYLASGLAAGEKVLYLVDVMTPAELRRNLRKLGVSVSARQESLTIADAASGYCPSGTFYPDEMLSLIQSFHLQAMAEGYAGSRGTGEMSWCLTGGRANRDDLMSYEARINLILKEHPYTTCCQYDATRFDGATIMDVLRVHPLMIVRGQLFRNPYFIDPAVFLEEQRAGRRLRADATSSSTT